MKNLLKIKFAFMYNLLKITIYFSVLVAFLQSCSSQKSGSISNENTEDIEENIGENTEEEKEEANKPLPSKPAKKVFVPELKSDIRKIIVLKDSKNESDISNENSSENEQLSVSNKHAKVLLFARKLQKGSYPITKNSLPYATVHVTLTQGQEKIEGDLEDGTVQILLLDSAGITKGSFEGTLIKNNERYFIGGNFSN